MPESRWGERFLALQHGVGERVRELEAAPDHVKRLQGLLPLCAWCHKVRNDRNDWQEAESDLTEQMANRITHRICPECRDRVRVRAAG